MNTQISDLLVRGHKLSELKQSRSEMALHTIESIFGVVTQVMYGPPSFLIARLYSKVITTQLVLLNTIDDIIRKMEN